jgi:hypothetical protein
MRILATEHQDLVKTMRWLEKDGFMRLRYPLENTYTLQMMDENRTQTRLRGEKRSTQQAAQKHSSPTWKLKRQRFQH